MEEEYPFSKIERGGVCTIYEDKTKKSVSSKNVLTQVCSPIWGTAWFNEDSLKKLIPIEEINDYAFKNYKPNFDYKEVKNVFEYGVYVAGIINAKAKLVDGDVVSIAMFEAKNWFTECIKGENNRAYITVIVFGITNVSNVDKVISKLQYVGINTESTGESKSDNYILSVFGWMDVNTVPAIAKQITELRNKYRGFLNEKDKRVKNVEFGLDGDKEYHRIKSSVIKLYKDIENLNAESKKINYIKESYLKLSKIKSLVELEKEYAKDLPEYNFEGGLRSSSQMKLKISGDYSGVCRNVLKVNMPTLEQLKKTIKENIKQPHKTITSFLELEEKPKNESDVHIKGDTIECPECHGAGEIRTGGGVIRCPECKGTGVIEEYHEEEYDDEKQHFSSFNTEELLHIYDTEIDCNSSAVNRICDNFIIGQSSNYFSVEAYKCDWAYAHILLNSHGEYIDDVNFWGRTVFKNKSVSPKKKASFQEASIDVDESTKYSYAARMKKAEEDLIRIANNQSKPGLSKDYFVFDSAQPSMEYDALNRASPIKPYPTPTYIDGPDPYKQVKEQEKDMWFNTKIKLGNKIWDNNKKDWVDELPTELKTAVEETNSGTSDDSIF